MGQTTIYHFTHESNLPKIFGEGALLCDQLCQARSLTTRDIAYSDLKRRRAQTRVEAGPGGTLADYVPFYFGTRSPMLYAYQRGCVTGRREDQNEIVYFVTAVEKISSENLLFAFSDGHPIKEPKAFYDDLAMLNQVDLALMHQTYWNDTDDDPDRKRRRQAEFLVWERVPLGTIIGLATRTSSKCAEVQQLLQEHAIEMPCVTKNDWYYR